MKYVTATWTVNSNNKLTVSEQQKRENEWRQTSWTFESRKPNPWWRWWVDGETPSSSDGLRRWPGGARIILLWWRGWPPGWSQKKRFAWADNDGDQDLGTGLRYIEVILRVAWYCIELYGIAYYCMVLHGIVLYCTILHGIVQQGLLFGIAWSCVVLHGIVQAKR